MRAATARWLAVCGLLLAAPAAAWAQKADDEEEEDAAADEGEDDTVVVPDDAAPAPKPREFKKQDLRGHDVGSDAATNPFLKDRFFVDKVDTKKTEDKTLVQGSLSSSTFAYTERSDDLGMGLGQAGSKFSRLFTDLRLQTDFRHIGGGSWDARIDARGRLVKGHEEASALSAADGIRTQSGLNGENEYEVREAWIVRSGKRSDVFFGRQFVTDLGAIKIDGLRIDYASSEKLTLIIFGGLYPLRGSRSLSTDYPALKTDTQGDAGKFVGAGGFGGAYRTPKAHGAIGGVVLAPFGGGETPRVYGVANGYYRPGPKLDLYHYAVIDAVGSAAVALTNLSAGLNYKPHQRLRLTASANRVDTETLNVQAYAFLNPIEMGGQAANSIQNETYISRLSTNAARASLSAGLGNLQRFELSVAGAYRYRPSVTLTSPDGNNNIELEAGKGADVFFALMDRRSIFGLRIGAEVSRSFAVGNVAYQRSEVLATRLIIAKELAEGRGEVEIEVGYATANDKPGGKMCATINSQCFGSSQSKNINAGANLYYRINRDWFALGSLFVANQNVSRTGDGTMATDDPAILSLTGFFRIAYRF